MTSVEFEKASLDWVNQRANMYPDAQVDHDITVSTRNGNYQLDGRIRFQAYGMPFTIIVECKRYSNSVKRDALVVLQDKIQELGAQKGILITTSSFQSGAVQYAKNHGLTLVQLRQKDGDFKEKYFTDFTADFETPIKKDGTAVPLRFPKMLTNPPSDIPLSYVPRDEDKDVILSHLSSGTSVLIHSIGGIGKTVLAKDILRSLRRTPSAESGFEAIAWVNCGGGTLGNALVSSLYETKDLTDFEFAWETARILIEQYREKLLIVADNLETLPFGEQEQLNDLPCMILATSRTAKCGALFPYSLSDLSPDACEVLFSHFYKGPKDIMSLRSIIELTDYHAVTVELLAKIANRAADTLEDFLGKLIDHGFALSQESVAADHESIRSERKLQNQISILFSMERCTPSQSSLLAKLSVLPAIPFQYTQVNGWLELQSRSSLEQLVDLGWITATGDFSPSYQVHSTVAAAIREQCRSSLYQLCRPVISNLLEEMTSSKYEYSYQKKKYITFSWSISDLLQDHLCDENDAAFLEALADIFEAVGNLRKGIELLHRALDIRKALDPEPKNLIYSWLSVGSLLLQAAEYPNAERYFKKALRAAQKEPENPRGIMLAKHYLAVLAVKTCDYSKAVRRYASAEKLYRKDELADAYDRAVFYIDYASFYRDYLVKGAQKKAEAFYKKGLVLFEEGQLTNHPEYAVSLCQFGLLYRDMGDFSTALEIEMKALDCQKKLLDEHSPDIADTYGTIGLLEYDLNHFPEAEQFSLKALEIFCEIYFEVHESIASVCNNLGLIYSSIPGRENEAEQIYQRSLGIRKKLYPSGLHLKLAESYNNLAQFYAGLGDTQKARSSFDHALEIYQKIGNQMEDYACILDNSANLALCEGDFKRAAQDAGQALKIRSVIDPDSYSCSFSHNTVGLICYQKGDLEKARQHFERCICLKKKALGNHIDDSLATAHFNLALVLDELGDEQAGEEYALAEQIYRKLGLDTDAELVKDQRKCPNI